MDYSVTIEGMDKLQRAFKATPEYVRSVMNPALHEAINKLAKYTTKGTVPWRTGRLTQSFIASYGDLMAMWRPTVNYALFVHEGTGPHVIVPVKKQALSWPGAAHPVKRVNHPGTRATPFMPRIIANAQSEINTMLQQKLDELTGDIANGG